MPVVHRSSRLAPVNAPMAISDSAAATLPTPNVIEIHAFNMPSAPSLLELEGQDRRKRTSVAWATPTAVAVSMALLVIAYLAVKQRRQHDTESKALASDARSWTTGLAEVQRIYASPRHPSMIYMACFGSIWMKKHSSQVRLAKYDRSQAATPPSCDELDVRFRGNSYKETPEPDDSSSSDEVCARFLSNFAW